MHTDGELGRHCGELVHGHSRLVYLIDEVEAHLLGLCELDDDDVEPIVEELLEYWSALRRELTDHMRDEEDEIFVIVDRLAPRFRGQIAKIRLQHESIEKALELIDEPLRALGASPQRADEAATLRRAVQKFREHFITHSRDEREVLGNVERGFGRKPAG